MRVLWNHFGQFQIKFYSPSEVSAKPHLKKSFSSKTNKPIVTLRNLMRTFNNSQIQLNYTVSDVFWRRRTFSLIPGFLNFKEWIIIIGRCKSKSNKIKQFYINKNGFGNYKTLLKVDKFSNLVSWALTIYSVLFWLFFMEPVQLTCQVGLYGNNYNPILFLSECTGTVQFNPPKNLDTLIWYPTNSSVVPTFPMNYECLYQVELT